MQIANVYCLSLEIQAGLLIAWMNADSEERVLLLERKDEQGVRSDSGGMDLLQPGTTFTTTLMDPGQYIHYCSKDRIAFDTMTVSPWIESFLLPVRMGKQAMNQFYG